MKIKTKIVSCHSTDSKPVKQEVNSTVILPLQYSLVIDYDCKMVAALASQYILFYFSKRHAAGHWTERLFWLSGVGLALTVSLLCDFFLW